MPPERATYLTPAAVAEILGLKKLDILYAHIRAGRLAAVNIGAGQTRPCWRISQAALDAFLEARTARMAVKPAARRRVRRLEATRYF